MSGNRYTVDEWVVFELEGYAEGEAQDTPGVSGKKVFNEIDFNDPKLEKARDAFTERAVYIGDKYSTEEEGVNIHDDDDVAWHTWASLVGHGIEGVPYRGPWWKRIHADKKLEAARQRLENRMITLTLEAAERAAR
jgi:hypothetical protein